MKLREDQLSPRVESFNRISLSKSFTEACKSVDQIVRPGYPSDDGDGNLTLCTMTHAAANSQVMLPGATGHEVCNEVESQQPDVPVIIVIWVGEALNNVSAIDFRANDCVNKPFASPDAAVRVERGFMSRRNPATSIATCSFGECEIDFAKMTVRRAGRPVTVTTLEFKLLSYFLDNAERVLSRDELLDKVWGYDCYPTTRSVDNLILKLRRKLEPNPIEPRHLKTVYGAGYKFIP